MDSSNPTRGTIALVDLIALPDHVSLPATPRDERPGPLVRPAEIACRLRDGGAPDDAAFDRYLAPPLRSVSARHWTPLAVVTRALEWFRTFGVRTVVDIGSGAGKFCVAGALAGESTFIGLERRPLLVHAARRLARAFGVADQALFVDATFGQDDIPLADAYYLFNPFAENVFGADDRIDEDVELGYRRYTHDIEATRRFLQALPTGTFVLTYHGFGGRVPAGFTVVAVDLSFSGPLRLWKKTSKRPNVHLDRCST